MLSQSLRLLAVSFLLSTVAKGIDKPNVLVIFVDDLKPTIGSYGDPIAVTPNMDRLASQGLRFDSAYTNQAICSPSRNSLMTGLRPQTIGIYDLSTHFRKSAPEAITLTQHFIAHGYHAQGLGKIYHVSHGNTDDKASWSIKSWRPKAPNYVTPESLTLIRPNAKAKKQGPATESADVPDETYADGLIATEAITRLTAASKSPDQAFFIAVGFSKPHLPFVAPQRYWDLYKPEALPMPSALHPPTNAPSFAQTKGGELHLYSDIPAVGPIDEATTRHLIHGYYAATSYADAQIGRVLNALESLDLSDNTIVVLWGDHGWHLGDHGMWAKHTNYEQAARIPLIVRAPGAVQGKSTSAMIETVDIYPTLAELAGIPQPMSIDGISFAPVIRNPESKTRDYATHVYPRGGRVGRAIRDSRFRMVEWKVPGKDAATAEIELYDYHTDPLETRNIAGANPKIVKAMRAELAKQPEALKQWKNTERK